jgi:hypothetical protein
MTGIVTRDVLPFSRTFFEKVPLQFVNLDALAKGALEDRALSGDAYWQIDTVEEPLAYLILRRGRPYRIIGYSGPSVTAFINWLRRDNRELTLTYRFVEEGTLPLLLRCWTEDPVLQDLEHGRGDLMTLLKSLRKISDNGLLKVKAGGNAILIPVEDGRITTAFGPGQVTRGKAIVQLLTEQLEGTAVGDFYAGQSRQLSQVGISEAQLFVTAFNAWLEASCPTWPECRRIASTVFSTVKEKETSFGLLSYDPDDGLHLQALPVETEQMPSAFMTLVRSLSRKHPSPDSCLRLFGSINREKKIALCAAGLSTLFEG